MAPDIFQGGVCGKGMLYWNQSVQIELKLERVVCNHIFLLLEVLSITIRKTIPCKISFWVIIVSLWQVTRCLPFFEGLEYTRGYSCLHLERWSGLLTGGPRAPGKPGAPWAPDGPADPLAPLDPSRPGAPCEKDKDPTIRSPDAHKAQ